MNSKSIHLLDLLDTGFKSLDTYTTPETATLVMGNTGAGKTTVVQIMAGNSNKLNAVLGPGNRLVIMDTGNRIGLPSTVSKTLIPELITTETNSMNFYDNPGFDDTRGPLLDIAANFFMNEVSSRAKYVKLLFIVTHSSVKIGNDRTGFDLLANHVAQFVKNLNKYQNSFALIVNKVDSYNSRGQFLSDKIVMEEIIEFLKTFYETLHDSLETLDPSSYNTTLAKISFVKSLLQTDKSTGEYKRIWFIRTPMKCGSLAKSEMMIYTMHNLTKIHNELIFTKVDRENDFGFTLKPATILKTTEYMQSINQKMANLVNQEAIKLLNFYVIESDKSVRSNQHDLKIVSSSLNAALLTFKNLQQSSLDGNCDSAAFMNKLRMLWDLWGRHLPDQFQSSIMQQERYVSFLRKATNNQTKCSMNIWYKPIWDLEATLQAHAFWYAFCLKLEARLMDYDFQERKNSIPD